MKTVSKMQPHIRKGQVKEGLEFVLAHFQEPLFPRKIMTKTLGYTVDVYNRQQAITIFEQSNFVDCRINAYRSYTDYHGVNRTAASFVMVDLDLKNFGYDQEKLDKTLNKTLKKIKEAIGGTPTVLWTGNGYHIYQPMDGFILDEIDVFAELVDINNMNHKDLTSKFMQFAEKFFTNRKNDPQHTATVKSCLVRIPHTFNSKCIENRSISSQPSEVTVRQTWDGYRAPINYLLRDFRRYLINDKLKELRRRRTRKGNHRWYQKNDKSTIPWIESLLQMPIEDGRKYAIWRIIAPYLLNKKGLTHEEAVCSIRGWLESCSALRKLDFDANEKIKESLRSAAKGYYPISLSKLKEDLPALYNHTQSLAIA